MSTLLGKEINTNKHLTEETDQQRLSVYRGMGGAASGEVGDATGDSPLRSTLSCEFRPF